MDNKEKRYITLGEFAALLGETEDSDILSFTPNDLLYWNTPIERGTAARLIRNYLKKALGEADLDESKWYEARVLKDLYDCHVCVGDIVQVYIKGIMDGVELPDGSTIFASHEGLKYDTAVTIKERVFNRDLRVSRISGAVEHAVFSWTDIATVIDAYERDEDISVIDLRMPGDYEAGHIKGAVNIPLTAYVKNPYMASRNVDDMVVFCCEEGYKSEIAANIAISSGFTNVYCLALIQEDSKQSDCSD